MSKPKRNEMNSNTMKTFLKENDELKAPDSIVHHLGHNSLLCPYNQ